MKIISDRYMAKVILPFCCVFFGVIFYIQLTVDWWLGLVFWIPGNSL